MENGLAKIVSYVFHPLAMTTFVFYLLLYHYPEIVHAVNGSYRWKFLIAVSIITYLIPAISSIMLKKAGYVKSLEMYDRSERKWPFIFTIVIYMIDCYFFYRSFQHDGFFILIIGTITLSLVVLAIISFWWKISIHGAGVGGLMAFYIVCSILVGFEFDMWWMIGIIMIVGVTMWARLQLNAHTLAQVTAGFFVGLGCGMLSLVVIYNPNYFI